VSEDPARWIPRAAIVAEKPAARPTATSSASSRGLTGESVLRRYTF